MLVAASNNNAGGTRAGRAYLFLGSLSGTISASATDRIFTGSEQNLLGTAVAPLGDLGGDGSDDFLIGGPGVFESGVLEYAAIFFRTGSTAVENETPARGFALLQNWPNPFDVSTRIVFNLPRSENVILRIFDALGREVETLASGPRPAGRSEIIWRPDGRPDGIYFYRLEADGVTESKKLLVRCCAPRSARQPR